MDEADVAHLAGVLDAAGVITVHITKSKDYSIGYQFQPTVRIHSPEEDKMMMGKLDAYCEEQTVQYSVSEKQNASSVSLEFEVYKPDSITSFLAPMMPHLVTNYEKAMVMVNEILPAVKDGKHRTKDGMLELLEPAEVLREATDRERPKYTRQYFEELWANELQQ